MTNKELCERYPFLLPRNNWTDELPDDFDYSYTRLDEMPNGWREAFGEQMCEDILQALDEGRIIEDYRILQIKEKFGELRWYGSFETKKMSKVINHYCDLSRKTCICCGAPAVWNSIGWIAPYCDNCARKSKRYPKTFEPIEKEEENK